jgi:hypothetical protein
MTCFRTSIEPSFDAERPATAMQQISIDINGGICHVTHVFLELGSLRVTTSQSSLFESVQYTYCFLVTTSAGTGIASLAMSDDGSMRPTWHRIL